MKVSVLNLVQLREGQTYKEAIDDISASRRTGL